MIELLDENCEDYNIDRTTATLLDVFNNSVKRINVQMIKNINFNTREIDILLNSGIIAIKKLALYPEDSKIFKNVVIYKGYQNYAL